MKSINKYDLFNLPPDDSFANDNKEEKAINGLSYFADFIDEKTESILIKEINDSNWLDDLKRRVQHYGWKYDYKSRSINYSMYLGQLPDWAEKIAKRLLSEKIINEKPDQVIVNEYISGQGIANHVDCTPCFSDTIISLSLGSHCIMDFVNVKSKEKIEMLLEPRSLVVISGDSRYEWTHGISARKTDYFKGKIYNRKTRLSLTFRKVIIADEKV